MKPSDYNDAILSALDNLGIYPDEPEPQEPDTIIVADGIEYSRLAVEAQLDSMLSCSFYKDKDFIKKQLLETLPKQPGQIAALMLYKR